MRSQHKKKTYIKN